MTEVSERFGGGWVRCGKGAESGDGDGEGMAGAGAGVCIPVAASIVGRGNVGEVSGLSAVGKGVAMGSLAAEDTSACPVCLRPEAAELDCWLVPDNPYILAIRAFGSIKSCQLHR